MIHQQRYIIGHKIIERGSLRKDVSYVFMIAFTAALLIGLLRIAVKDPALGFTGRAIKLNRKRVSEFGSAISQDEFEDGRKSITKDLPHICKSSRNTGGSF